MQGLLFWCFKILFLLPAISQATEMGNIYFPADKNGARLLSQKLEYQVINDDSIKLGNLLVNTADVKIELSNTSDENPIFAFWGPAQLMRNSTLLIRDPTGRSIWTYKINNQELVENQNTDAKLRNNLAAFHLKTTDPQMVKNLSNAIFFNYCVFYEDSNHRYNLCSKDYRLEKSNKSWILNPITSTKKDFIIQVNGTEVGQEGLIQLSEKISTISFSSRLATGLLLEFRTRNIPIEIIDSRWESETDYAELIIREKNLSDKFNLKNSWSAKVPFAQSYFFLEGESQIPLKQEVFFDEKPPSEKVRPTLINHVFKTYSGSLSVDLKKAPETTIKAKTKGDTAKNRKAISNWDINNIKMDGSNTHYIEITNQNKKYLASYEVLRGLPWLTKLNLKSGQGTSSVANNPSESLSGSGSEFDLIYHATTFFGSNANWCQLKWFTELNVQNLNYKSKTGTKSKTQDQSLDFGYRFNYGFHHETASMGLSFGLLSRKTDSDSASSPSFGVFYKNPNVNLFAIGETFYTDFKFYPALQYSQTKLTGSMMHLQLESQYNFNKKVFWFWNFDYQSESLKSKIVDLSIKTQSTEFSLGIGGVF